MKPKQTSIARQHGPEFMLIPVDGHPFGVTGCYTRSHGNVYEINSCKPTRYETRFRGDKHLTKAFRRIREDNKYFHGYR